MIDANIIDLLGAYDNLHDPKPIANNRGIIIGVTTTCVILSWSCGFFRLYTRYFVIYSPGWDDFFLALVLITGLMGALSMGILTDHGLGDHFVYLSVAQMEGYLKGFYVANISYVMSTAFIKISLLLQYLRVFEERALRTTCITILVLVSLWGLTFTILAFVPCVPVYDYWDLLSGADKTCFGYGATTRNKFTQIYISHAGFNLTFDVLVLSLPMFLLRRETTTRALSGLVSLLLMGCLVVSVSIWRLATLVEHQATTYPTFDPTWYSPISSILSAVEVDIASICASVPVFWPVLTNSLGEIFVTKEIQVIHEDRVDMFELHRVRSESSGTFLDCSVDCTDESNHVHNSDPARQAFNFNRAIADPFASDEEKAIRVLTHVRSESGAKN
ncbi:hypothetical protein BJ170DRAFT_317134 [Xylariales sp. AK1849]|nr:hypothetical protein BJ170DRAFT_317134 [Xylariales sp. AK1849]